ncbi:MAG: hypothetical protein A2622_11720 [Bdellovibrionales bacterium RIFCSPHIGHO2_01_FULL_40_29]|nr:MAG: hypothetical protein A2622_11720 [Bdellovibrionales bacterium RIFCSPHIGHO2_01_FULL_40_29]OFZ35275.1 MAG: hypothetical protein A3D17_08715 [Bdellovibrionales bacterium RIFCSPHIGHO2_02_FULL_40_15]
MVNSVVNASLNTGEGLYSQTNGSFNSEKIYDIFLEYSSNKAAPEHFGVSIGYQFSKYENRDFGIKNEKQSFLAKIKYFPFLESTMHFAAIIYPNLGYDEYSISSSNTIQTSLKGLGIAIGYDFTFNERYLIRAEYSMTKFYSDKFNSDITTLALGVGYKW